MRKNIFYTMIQRLFSFFLLFSLITACNQAANVADLQGTPEEAAKAFMEAFSAQEFQKAEALGTAHTKKQIRYFATELGMVGEKERSEMLAGFVLNFEKVECKEQGGAMRCKICCGADGAEAELELMQQDEKWFVQVTLGDYEAED